jgi:hypothetical protein
MSPSPLATAGGAGADAPSRPRAEVTIHIEASALAGITSAPAHLAGYGWISPEVARQLLREAEARAQLAVVDPFDGALLSLGARRRIVGEDPPGDPEPPDDEPPDDEPPDDEDPPNGGPPDDDPPNAGPPGGRPRTGGGQAVPSMGRARQPHPDPGPYRIPAAMKRFVRARDVTCRFPGCRRPARYCDVDHVDRWPFGPTHPDNLVCLCRRHHRLKHSRPWHVRLTDCGTLVWISRTGRTRLVSPSDTMRQRC